MQLRGNLRGRRYLVYGLALSGLAAVRFLARSGAAVVAWDDAAAARDAAAAIAGVEIADPAARALADFDGLVVSPGVPLDRHPLVARARAAQLPVIGDMELFQWLRPALPPHRVVAITGTNGKSTTTALIHHMLEVAGVPALLGGNIGRPILDGAALPAGGVYVLELSSFQIDLCQTFAADIGVYLNLTPDHLDRHGGMAGYAAAKARLFALQQPGACAVIATDDDYTRAAAAALPAGVRLRPVQAADVAPAEQARWPALAGPHNAQNVACARAVADELGLDAATIQRALASFPGLAHRMEVIREVGGVLYVNDSKATNPASAAPALAAYPAIHWILGGHAKTDELDACLPYLGHVRRAYVIGEAAALFRRILAPHLPVQQSGTLGQAVADAAARAVAGETVLLAPACSSFDQFQNFEQRGEAFRSIVQALAGGGAQ